MQQIPATRATADTGGGSPSRAVDRIAWVTDLIRLEIVLWERIDASLRDRHGLPLSFFETLYVVSRAPGGTLRVGDLARGLRVTVGGTSKLVDRIEAAGLIVRRADPDDRRAARIILTPRGKRKLAAATNTYEQTAALLDRALSPAQQEQMHRYVARLLAAVVAEEQGGPR